MNEIKIRECYFKPIPPHYSDDFKSIIANTLTKDPAARWSIDKILSVVTKHICAQNEPPRVGNIQTDGGFGGSGLEGDYVRLDDQDGSRTRPLVGNWQKRQLSSVLEEMSET